MDETRVTTTNITAERASTLIDQFTFKDPEFIQVAIIALCSYPDETTLKNMNKDNNAEIETKIHVINCDNLSPMFLPKKPDMIEPSKGKNNIKYSIYPFNLSISSTLIVPEFL